MLDDWTDRLNPVFLREIRQQRKSWLMLGAFGLLLFLCWLYSLIRLLKMPDISSLQRLGPEFFVVYYHVLLGCLFLTVPLQAYQLTQTELAGDTLELLVITPLNSAQIFAGKLQAALLPAVLMASSTAPFLVVAYLLGGVELSAMLAALAGAVAVTCMLGSMAIAAATLFREAWGTVVLAAISGGLAWLGGQFVRETIRGGFSLMHGLGARFFYLVPVVMFLSYHVARRNIWRVPENYLMSQETERVRQYYLAREARRKQSHDEPRPG